MATHRIIVLMSTFNGEKYLREQLESIFLQEGVDIFLMVRDDGSSDGTFLILSEWLSLHPGHMEVIEGNNIGWKKSFFRLIEYAARYYGGNNYFAFADQDDIWLPGKLKAALDILDSHNSKPALYCSNLTLFSGESTTILRSAPVTPGYKNCLVRNYAAGCTIVFNRRLLNLLKSSIPEVDVAHDYWAYMVATLCGVSVIDHESYILYRRHDANQVGFARNASEVWRRRLHTLWKSLLQHSREKIAGELLRLHADHMHPDAKLAVKKMADYRSSFRNKLNLLKDPGYTFGLKSNDFWLKLRILTSTL